MKYYKHDPRLTPTAQKLRKNMTREERHLWYGFLRSYPVRFLRQKIIDGYIVDFYCHAAGLVLELDGSQHYEEQAIRYDLERTRILECRGLRVIRIPNSEVERNFRGVCEWIDHCVQDAANLPCEREGDRAGAVEGFKRGR